MPVRIRLAAVLSVALVTVAAPSVAQTRDAAETPAERCVAAADRGQLLRDEGKLMESRAELAGCGAEVCPAVVRKECVRWLEELATRIPSIIPSARDGAGRDLPSAKVFVDGTPLTAARAGRAIELDPGKHTIRAEVPGRASVEESFVLRERERDRVVPIVVRTPGELVVRTERRVPVLSWVLGGVAVAGGVGFGVLWAKGMGDVSDLRATCSPYCTAAQVDDVRPTLDIARISAGVGIAAALGAVAIYALTPPKPLTTAGVRVEGFRVVF